MMKNILSILLLVLIPCINLHAQDNGAMKKKINSVKKNTSVYLYGEATAATEQEARDLAEEILYNEINKWAATKKKLQNSTNLIVNNKQSLWTNVSLPRGNMYRSFIYVKKADIIPAENTEVIEKNTPSLVSEVSEVKTYPAAVLDIAACAKYDELVSKIEQLKADGKIRYFARYAKLDNPESYYLAVYDTEANVIAVLTPGSSRRNVKTSEADGVKNYPGCGAIGFIVNE